MFIENMTEWKEKLRAVGLTDDYKTEPSFAISLCVSTDRDGHDDFREIAEFVDNVRAKCEALGINPNMLTNRRDDGNSDHEMVTRYVSFLPPVKVGKRAYHEKFGIVLVDEIDWNEGGICTIETLGAGTQARCQYHSLEGREF